MRLLLVTFALDTHSPALAWQARVAAELGRLCDRVVVLTHRVGAFEPQRNVIVVTLPRSSMRSVSPLKTFCGKASAASAPSFISAIGKGSHTASPRPCASR